MTPASNPNATLLEGVDYYYLENGMWVFTAAYHRNRGYCCGNFCRHCPYSKSPADRRREVMDMEKQKPLCGKVRESGMPDPADWETFFNPHCILERLGCGDCTGDAVEFGCGYGTFTLPAAELVDGRVFALDIEPALVAETARKSAEAGLSNIVAEERDFVADGCGRPDASIRYAMLFNILHTEDPIGLLREARRALAPGGTAAIIHWRKDLPTPRGPSPDIRPDSEQCRAWGEAAGLEFVRYESLSCCSWHWGLIMRRP